MVRMIARSGYMSVVCFAPSSALSFTSRFRFVCGFYFPFICLLSVIFNELHACIEFSMCCHLCRDDIRLGQYLHRHWHWHWHRHRGYSYIYKWFAVKYVLFVLADVPNTAREMFALETKLCHTKHKIVSGRSSLKFWSLYDHSLHIHSNNLLKYLFTLFASLFSRLSKFRFNIVCAQLVSVFVCASWKRLSIAIIYHIRQDVCLCVFMSMRVFVSVVNYIHIGWKSLKYEIACFRREWAMAMSMISNDSLHSMLMCRKCAFTINSHFSRHWKSEMKSKNRTEPWPGTFHSSGNQTFIHHHDSLHAFVVFFFHCVRQLIPWQSEKVAILEFHTCS